MAISITSLTTGTGKYGSGVYTTSSVSVSAGDILCLAVTSANGAAPTVSGLGLTWTMENGQAIVDEGWKDCYVSLWYAVPTASTSGAITITAASGGSTDACAWSVFSIQGADTATPFVQSGSAYGTGTGSAGPVVTVSLATFSKPENATLEIGGDFVYTPPNTEAGYTTIHSTQTDEAAVVSAWLNAEDTTPTMDVASVSTYYGIAVVAAEINDASTGGGTFTATATIGNNNDSISSSGTVTVPVFAAVGGVSNNADAILVAGTVVAPQFTALGDITETADSINSIGGVTAPQFNASGAVINTDDGITVNGTVTGVLFTASGNIGNKGDTVAVAATATAPIFTASGVAAEKSDTFSITGTVTVQQFNASIQIQTKPDSIAANGSFFLSFSAIG
ncbi:MAG: hypothetical protein D6712_18885, partial [Chloroflexi bacterium]